MTTTRDSNGNLIDLGSRVELLPHTDLWMRGVRYATVRGLGRKYIRIFHEMSGTEVNILPEQVLVIS